MKKIKLIPALALVALMSGCTTSKNFSLKKPSFAKMGKEVTYSEFVSGVEEAMGAIDFFDDETFTVQDAVMNMSVFTMQRQKITSGKNVEYIAETKSAESTSSKFDADNIVMSGKGSSKSYKAFNYPSVKQTNYDDENYEITMQQGKINDRDYIVRVEELSKTYSPYKAVTEEHPIKDRFASLAYGTLNSVFNEYSNYFDVEMSEAEQAEYKFYQNGKVFTGVKDINRQIDEKDGEEHVWGKSNTKFTTKIQIDLTPGKVKGKVSYEMSGKLELIEDHEDLYAGNIVEEAKKEYVDYSMEYKKVELKAKDLSKYKFVDNRT